MRFFLLSSLVGPATAVTCAITGGGNCRSCAATGCELVVQFPDATDIDFACIWPVGETVGDDQSGGRLSWTAGPC